MERREVLVADKFGYVIDIEQYCTHSERENERYGSWSESYDNSFREVHKSNKTTDYPEVVQEVDIPEGTECWVVWLEYSIGDSFGWADRGRVQGIAVFTNYEDANNLTHLLKAKTEYEFTNPNQTWTDVNQVVYETTYGEVLKIYTGDWTGYFERLEDVYIERTWMHGSR